MKIELGHRYWFIDFQVTSSGKIAKDCMTPTGPIEICISSLEAGGCFAYKLGEPEINIYIGLGRDSGCISEVHEIRRMETYLVGTEELAKEHWDMCIYDVIDRLKMLQDIRNTYLEKLKIWK